MDSLVSRETLIAKYFPYKTAEIERYAQFLAVEGALRGLIGPRESEKIWERHIFNSLPVSSLIPEGATVIDLGSGAGLPGIPLALSRPDISMVLLEPLQRRVDFLELACEGLGITVIRGRAQDVKARAQIVTARAVAPLEKLKSWSWHLLNKGGSLLAIKGESAGQEVVTVAGAQLHEIKLDGLELGRVISLRKGA